MSETRKFKNMQFKPNDFAEIARLAKLLSEAKGLDVTYVGTVMYAMRLLAKELEAGEG